MEAAAYVDLHVAHVAHKVRPAQLDRLVEEAIGRFMPEEADRRRLEAADGRCFTVDPRQPSLRGTSQWRARPRRRPRPRRRRHRRRPGVKDLGSTDTLDVRRAVAVGDLARRQLTLDLNPTPDPRPRRGPRRRTAGHRPTPAGKLRGRPAASRVRGDVRAPLRRAVTPGAPLAASSARVENTRGPVHAEQIRQWCGNPYAEVTVQPVIDLNEHIHIEAYEIRGRLRNRPCWST